MRVDRLKHRAKLSGLLRMWLFGAIFVINSPLSAELLTPTLESDASLSAEPPPQLAQARGRSPIKVTGVTFELAEDVSLGDKVALEDGEVARLRVHSACFVELLQLARRQHSYLGGTAAAPPSQYVSLAEEYLPKLRRDLAFAPLPVASDPLLIDWCGPEWRGSQLSLQELQAAPPEWWFHPQRLHSARDVGRIREAAAWLLANTAAHAPGSQADLLALERQS